MPETTLSHTTALAVNTSVNQDSVIVPDHKFPPVGGEPFNLTEDELREAWGPEKPRAEKDVREAFERIVSPTFKLIPEVWLRHFSDENLRIDYVGLDRQKRIPDPIGFELKRGNLGEDEFSEFTCAVRQSIDYAKSTIADPRASIWAGAKLRFVFVFACPYQIYEIDNRNWRETYRDLWAQGALKLAAESGVGAMAYIPRRKQDWCMVLGGHPAWWLKSGPTALALKHARSKNVGSAA